MTTVQDLTKDGLLGLFAISTTQEFFNLSAAETKEVSAAIKAAFDDLQGKFGMKVLGTFDDDLLQCGETKGYPYIAYILAEIPNLEAAIGVTNLVRTSYKDHRIVKYLNVDARIGHPLFFGTA